MQGNLESKTFTRENNWNWTGELKEYCKKGVPEFRRRIHAFLDYKCTECRTPQTENYYTVTGALHLGAMAFNCDSDIYNPGFPGYFFSILRAFAHVSIVQRARSSGML